MPKTPDEIKKGLECCKEDECFGDRENCPYTADPKLCVGVMCADAFALIQQLQAQNTEQAEIIRVLEDHLREATKKVEQLEASVPRWISVEEKEKPRFRQDCLCLCSYSDTKNHEWDYMMVLSWMGEGENGYVNRPHFQHEGMNGMIVTHWMPLPEPPKEAAT